MRALDALRNRNMTAAAALTAVALLLVGCGRDLADARAQGASASAAAPVSVACEPNQRAIVRPVVINGASVSQVECTSVGAAVAPVAYQAAPGAVPVSYATPLTYATPGTLDNARVVPVNYPVRTVEPRRASVVRRTPVAYERSGRSVKKSALIIGGSAGAGAGLGAALGGKKGALVGGLIGGGAATLWDQITRHK